MAKGINRAVNQSVIKSYSSIETASKTPCIFLSHQSLDKELVKKIGDYITNAGIDIYLDIYDRDLQNANRTNNDLAITECIEKGIKNSTHVMCIISRATKSSWWVPYEIGYGKKNGNEISTLPLKELLASEHPSYLKITRQLTGIKSFNAYLVEILREKTGTSPTTFASYQESAYKSFSNASILTESTLYHPLCTHLNQL
ncbi:protein of unknown function DUF1863 [Ruminiclostridium papyrosolvens DSM 2782]|uniref:TIR domain-containing protein n=1 Tax=Ruminiclostridium papyrosolvens DSM 2782 TaxID=588581 RepID=F1THG1_9FIRM|nr:toll/interleukin-1 receptor domain-containing protein [Ruminiclostridium papyrosolvens]EGD46164.1 protein of unknown function DUF1863 [Ruminiclostridium papyrosolvens DSM 2782]WES35944.1 toll/interleukin-1 receptor domain-containing protein [Ruminiclostridium papyrosolvens DSM 2782]